MPDLRSSIHSALQTLASGPLRDSAKNLLKTLGYESDRTLNLEGSKPQAFLDLISSQGGQTKFDETKALFSDWKSADILFQLSDADISRERSLFKDTTVLPGLLQSYLFFAIELTGKDYARGKLTTIARQLNRVFPMPVMVLLKHGDTNGAPALSIAVINRRRNKLHAEKDVLEKVTLIRDISLAQPHRGHLDILASFALENLVHPKKLPIQDFDTLHAAWEQVFNIELLNARFYKELSNWYFWALPQVEFPADLEPDSEKRRATGLIRLLTRLVFCWFLKEKDGLIPEKLFHPADLAEILNGFDPESETSSTYYQAILQNLFFATLNQRMGKDAKGQPHRFFVTDEGFPKNRATHDVNNLYRYEKLFAVPQEQALALFADIPFLNGGLFECLDRTEESGTDNPVYDSSEKTDKIVRSTFKKRYLDGFSRNPKKRPHVPDRLFFDSGETTDLSTAYGDKKRKAEKVTGLITILNRYKFTIVENTPIDQEIALDPELLGKVFENLLASYNEETKTTARKQTGSFYTPRPIVDYMVDESLKAHLLQKVEQTILSAPPLKLYNPEAATHKTHRNLPHWTQEGTTYWITFRLGDSLPAAKLKQWQQEKDTWLTENPEPRTDEQWKDYDECFGQRLDDWLDAGEGDCHLRRPDVREIVECCLLHFEGQRYDLPAWVIMPNHVHLLLRPRQGHTLSKIMQGLKGVSAKECNALLGRTGETFWQDESFDHIVRSQAQFDRFVRYIVENPVKARLKDGEFSVAETILSGSSESQAGEKQTGLSAPLSQKLDHLFTYTEEPHQFSEPEVATLIAAIDACKILDPACGSGAFPMGVLHKLVYILSKLDERNEKWRDIQIERVQVTISAAEKIDDATIRDSAITDLQKQITSIHSAFADNELDYGRKLYLIENCLYGVDIQPIAIQITKLRFFISLVCDQKTNRNKKDNHGIRPLPNLETKFVAADTLIGLPEMQQSLLVDPRVGLIEKEIEALYHSHFSEQRRDRKLANQRKVKVLRQDLGKLLAESLMSPAKSKHVAEWDPFDPQSSADFFDPHWMFGKSLAGGFDIVIGNPPYGAVLTDLAKAAVGKAYKHQDYQLDTYLLFVERGIQLLRRNGIQSLIIPNTWLPSLMLKSIRKFVVGSTTLVSLADIRTAVFAAVVDTTILTHRNLNSSDNCFPIYTYIDDGFELLHQQKQSEWNVRPGEPISVALTPSLTKIASQISGSSTLGDLFVVTQGSKLYQTGKGVPPQNRETVDLKPFTSDHEKPGFRPLLRGKHVVPFQIKWDEDLWVRYGTWLAEPRASAGFDEPEKIVIRQTGDTLIAALDTKRFVTMDNLYTIRQRTGSYSLSCLLALLNSSVLRWYYRKVVNPEVGEALAQVKKGHLVRLPTPDLPDNSSKLIGSLTKLIQFAKADASLGAAAFLEDLIDACVMECYFREHMAERDLLFHDAMAPHLAAYDPSASATQQREFLTHLHTTLNAPSHPIHNRLLRLTSDSPDLLAVIKREGKV